MEWRVWYALVMIWNIAAITITKYYYLEYWSSTEDALLYLGVTVEDASTECWQVVKHQVSSLSLARARLARDHHTLVTSTLGQGCVRCVCHSEDMRCQVTPTTTTLVHRHVLGVVNGVVAEGVDSHQDCTDVRVNCTGIEATSKTVNEGGFAELG